MRARSRLASSLVGLLAALVPAPPVLGLTGNGPPGDIVDAIPALAVFALIAVLTTLVAISEARR